MEQITQGKLNHVRDDTILQEKTAVLNELNAKKQAVSDEIAECENRITDFSHQQTTRDAVTDALEFDIGVPVPQHIANQQVKLSVLRNQFNKLTRAIQIQHEVYSRESQNAGYRVFAQNHSQYMAHGQELLKAVDHVIAINKKLHTEKMSLIHRGCNDLTEISFPAYGLADQIIEWRKGLQEALCTLERTIVLFRPEDQDKKAVTKDPVYMEARVIASIHIHGKLYESDDVVTLEESEIKRLKGYVDANPDSVNYAKSQKKTHKHRESTNLLRNPNETIIV